MFLPEGFAELLHSLVQLKVLGMNLVDIGSGCLCDGRWLRGCCLCGRSCGRDDWRLLWHLLLAGLFCSGGRLGSLPTSFLLLLLLALGGGFLLLLGLDTGIGLLQLFLVLGGLAGSFLFALFGLKRPPLCLGLFTGFLLLQPLNLPLLALLVAQTGLFLLEGMALKLEFGAAVHAFVLLGGIGELLLVLLGAHSGGLVELFVELTVGDAETEVEFERQLLCRAAIGVARQGFSVRTKAAAIGRMT